MKTTAKTVTVVAVEVGDWVYVLDSFDADAKTAWLGEVEYVAAGWVGIRSEDGRIDEVQVSRVLVNN